MRLPEIGHYYERYDGAIRRVDEIRHNSAGPYIMGASRRPMDAGRRWPGSWGAYLPIFWENTRQELTAYDVTEYQFDAAYGPWLLAQQEGT
jgi:hypothetical protein